MSSEQLEALQAEGYHLWDWDVNIPAENTASAYLRQARTALQRARSGSVIRMPDNAVTAEALPDIVSYLRRNNYIVEQIGEWSAPVNFHDIG